jgi:Tfp pilus assembly protein PilZ
VIVSPPPAATASAESPAEPSVDAEPITILKSEPPPPGSLAGLPLGRAETWTEMRSVIRHLLEIEVVVEAEGVRHVGFTENMSTGGVFVATYLATRPFSKLTVTLTMRGGETLRLAGEVRWQRPASSERWPGIGVKFEDSGPEHDARMNRLLSLRDRLI